LGKISQAFCITSKILLQNYHAEALFPWGNNGRECNGISTLSTSVAAIIKAHPVQKEQTTSLKYTPFWRVRNRSALMCITCPWCHSGLLPAADCQISSDNRHLKQPIFFLTGELSPKSDFFFFFFEVKWFSGFQSPKVRKKGK
jgi:hypothetical protein